MSHPSHLANAAVSPARLSRSDVAAARSAHVPELILERRPAEIVFYAVVRSWLGGHPSRRIAAVELARGCGYTPPSGSGLPRALSAAARELRAGGELLTAAAIGRVSSYTVRRHDGARYAAATGGLLQLLRSGEIGPAMFAHLLREQRGTGPDGVSRVTTAEYATRWGCTPRAVRYLRQQAADAGWAVDVDGGVELSPALADPYAPQAVDNAAAAEETAGGSGKNGGGSAEKTAGVLPLEPPLTPSQPLAVGEEPTVTRARARPHGDQARDRSMGRPDVARLLAQVPPQLVPPRYGMRVHLARLLAAALDDGLAGEAILRTLDLRIDPAAVGRSHLELVRQALDGLRGTVTRGNACAACGRDESEIGCPGCGPADLPWSADDQAALDAAQRYLGVGA